MPHPIFVSRYTQTSKTGQFNTASSKKYRLGQFLMCQSLLLVSNPFTKIYSSIMMNECDGNIGSAGISVDNDKIQEEKKFDTVISPEKQSQDIDVNSKKNPFDDDDIGDLHNVYERVSLTATVSKATAAALNRDWDSEWAHVASCVKRNFTSVSVISPEVISTMMTKHVVYTVKTEPQKYVVRRRYNDFAWLRDSLALTYEGLFIPSIPATTVFSKGPLGGGSKTDVNGDFVKNRMQQLQLFIDQISKIPFLWTDPSLHSFLSVKNDKEFKQITDTTVSVVNGGGVENWMNVGLNMWLKLVDNTLINPGAADRVVSDFKRQLDLLTTVLAQVENEARQAGRKAVANAGGMSALSDQVAAWASTEVSLLDPDRNEYINPYGTAKRAHMEALASGQAHWSTSLALVPKILARLLMSNVQFQQVQVARFREHLVARDALTKELEKAQRERAKAYEEVQVALAPPVAGKRQSRGIMFSKGPEELEEVLQRRTEQVEQLQSKWDRLTKGLTFCEIHRFNRDRQQSLGSMLGALAATHLQIAQATMGRWNELVTQLGLDVQMHADSVAVLLSSSSVLDEDLLGFSAASEPH